MLPSIVAALDSHIEAIAGEFEVGLPSGVGFLVAQKQGSWQHSTIRLRLRLDPIAQGILDANGIFLQEGKNIIW